MMLIIKYLLTKFISEGHFHSCPNVMRVNSSAQKLPPPLKALHEGRGAHPTPPEATQNANPNPTLVAYHDERNPGPWNDPSGKVYHGTPEKQQVQHRTTRSRSNLNKLCNGRGLKQERTRGRRHPKTQGPSRFHRGGKHLLPTREPGSIKQSNRISQDRREKLQQGSR